MNTPDDWKTTARIINPTRATLWRQVFGGEEVPIRSIIPTNVNLPGHPDTLAYFLDLSAITPEQRQRLITAIAEKFHLPPAEVAADIDAGVPILASDVIVSSTDRSVLASLF